MKHKQTELQFPDCAQIESEIRREDFKKNYRHIFRSTINALALIAAFSILVSMFLFPVLNIYGNSMAPTLDDGQMVIALKSSKFKQGDVIAFYYNNKILVKRAIAGPGDWVNIREDGSVYVNDKLLEEPYISEKAQGQCDLKLPYCVPESKYFVLGDRRSASMDSRNGSIGCISQEQVIGKIILRLWPIADFGIVG